MLLRILIHEFAYLISAFQLFLFQHLPSPPSLKRHDPTPADRGGVVAEREGFEPSVAFLLRTLSKGVL